MLGDNPRSQMQMSICVLSQGERGKPGPAGPAGEPGEKVRDRCMCMCVPVNRLVFLTKIGCVNVCVFLRDLRGHMGQEDNQAMP